MTRSYLAASLSVLFLGLWIASGVFWITSYHSWNAAAFSAVAPLVWSTELSSASVAAMSAGFSSFALAAAAVALWRPQSRIASGVAHLGLALYFAWSLMLVGIGV
jgi:hypothetical protein